MMKLTLHIIEKDKDWEETISEFDHDMEVSAEEYDFILRMFRKNRKFHGNSMQDKKYLDQILLSRHAPQLGKKVSDECWKAMDAIGNKTDRNFLFQWGEQVVKDSQYREEDLASDDECEVLLATFCGAVITEKNIIGCHYRRNFIYDTSPDDADGITNRRGFDAIDVDIFGCDLEYLNKGAYIAERKGQFKFVGTTFSVEYKDEHRGYQILKKEYNTEEWEPESLSNAMKRSLRVIWKKILRRELDRII